MSLPGPMLKVLVLPFMALFSVSVLGHDVPESAYLRLQNGNWFDFMWVGAEHMVTGYDHLLFLLGVVFFLNRLMDVIKFITAFTLGHTIVLLAATFAGISANHYLIDAFIGATVVYKAFENLGGFQKLLGFNPPNLLAMVFIFGLVHGFGLSSQLQLLTLAADPRLAEKILWFNLGVELGQVAALLVMVIALNAWRKTTLWQPISRTVNGSLIIVGFFLVMFQMHGYWHEGETPASSEQPDWHRHGDGEMHRH